MPLFGKKKEPMQDPFGAMPPGMANMDSSQQPPSADPYYGNPPPPDMMPPDMQMPDQNMQMQPNYQQYPDPQMPQNFSNQQYAQPFPSQDSTKERVEEIAEAIIDEKWNELIKDINKVIEWKERTDIEIKTMQQEISDLKERFEALHSGILGKISEYDQNLANVGTEIKAMEMTFQKILPTFTENVNKLDRLVKNAGSR